MTFDNKIRIQRKIIRETRLFLILDGIRRNTKSHDKKETKKKNTTSY